jgi:hypothetical protein
MAQSSSFSNFFKFGVAAVLILLISLLDFKDTMAAAVKSRAFFLNNLNAPELFHPIMDKSWLVRAHPWLFVYLAGVFRATGFMLIVYAATVTGLILILLCFSTFGNPLVPNNSRLEICAAFFNFDPWLEQAMPSQ